MAPTTTAPNAGTGPTAQASTSLRALRKRVENLELQIKRIQANRTPNVLKISQLANCGPMSKVSSALPVPTYNAASGQYEPGEAGGAGYASLTGTGSTDPHGALTQAGDFEVVAGTDPQSILSVTSASGINMSTFGTSIDLDSGESLTLTAENMFIEIFNDFELIAEALSGTPTLLLLQESGGHYNIDFTAAGGGDFTVTSGGIDMGATGLAILSGSEARLEGGHSIVAADGIFAGGTQIGSDAGLGFLSVSFTVAFNEAGLIVPPGGSGVAFGFTQGGHIYFSSGGAYSLLV